LYRRPPLDLFNAVYCCSLAYYSACQVGNRNTNLFFSLEGLMSWES
jgi:hypothetical protein